MEYLTFTIKVSSDFLSNENFFDLFSLLGCSSSSSVGNFSSPDSVSVKNQKLSWPFTVWINCSGHLKNLSFHVCFLGELETPKIYFKIKWLLKVGRGGHAPATLDSLAMVWYVLRKKLVSNLLNSLRKLILKSFWPLSLSVCLKVYGNTGCGVFKGGIQNQNCFLARGN